MAQRVLRPMEYGDLFDEVFDLYKTNFALFAGIVGLVYVPYILFSGYFLSSFLGVMGTTMFSPTSNPASPPNPSAILPHLIPLGGMVLVMLFVFVPLYLMMTAALTWAISSRYLGNTAGILSSYKAVLPRFWIILATAIIGLLMYLVGLVLCILPGIAVAILLVFVSEVVVLEDKGTFDAIARSFKLAASDLGRVLVVLLLGGILVWIVSAVLSLPFQLILSLHPAAGPPTNPAAMGAAMGPLMWLQTLSQGIASVLTVPLMTAAYVLLYYDIRVRKEGFDIELLAQSMGSAPIAPERTTELPPSEEPKDPEG